MRHAWSFLLLGSALLAQQPDFAKRHAGYAEQGYTIQQEVETYSTFTAPTGETYKPVSVPRFIAYSARTGKYAYGSGEAQVYRESVGRGIHIRRVYGDDGDLVIADDVQKTKVVLYDMHDKPSQGASVENDCRYPESREKLVGWENLGGLRAAHYVDNSLKNIIHERWVWVEAGCDAVVQEATIVNFPDGTLKSSIRTVFRSVAFGEPDPRLFDTSGYEALSSVPELNSRLLEYQAKIRGIPADRIKQGMPPWAQSGLNSDTDAFKNNYKKRPKEANEQDGNPRKAPVR